MSTATHIPLAEYLGTTYEPECEYIEGELKERNVGGWQHARVQWLLALWFGTHEADWNIIGSTEQRVQIAAERIRVPDLVILRPGEQREVLTEPPLLVVEILSPGDTYIELEGRCRDYVGLGVQTIWIIDPNSRTGRMCLGAQWLAAERLDVPGTPIFVSLDRLFSQLNRSADRAV